MDTEFNLRDVVSKFFDTIFSEERDKIVTKGDRYIPTAISGSNIDSKNLYQFYISTEEIDPDTKDIFTEDVVTFMAGVIYYDLFEFCGCGYVDGMMLYLLKVLCLFNDDEYYLNWVDLKNELGIDLKGFSETVDITNFRQSGSILSFEALLYMLDAKGLTDHGHNIFGSNLTEKGILVREIFRKYAEYLSEDDQVDCGGCSKP